MGRLFGDGAAMDGRGVEAVVVEWIMVNSDVQVPCETSTRQGKGMQ